MEQTIQAIEKREDVSPQEGKSKYGDVTYADERNKKYPLDSEKHVRAAYAYLSMPKNQSFYSKADVSTMMRKIKAAGKKYGIEFSDDNDKTESSLVACISSTASFDGTTPEEIVYLPKGRSKISATSNGKPKVVEVVVDANAAAALQADLGERLRETVRPVAGFDHKDGPASFIPKEFKWDSNRGVVLEVDWTDAGKNAIGGRNYSYFSPTFLMSGGTVAGLPKTGEIGSLTNNPAFRGLKKIAASQSETDMSKVIDQLVELEIITAEQAEGADEDLISGAIKGLHTELAETKAANATLEQKNIVLEAKAKEIAKAEAIEVVQAAINEGKIGIKDQISIDFYTAQMIANPETTRKVIAAMSIPEVLKKVIDVKAGDSKKMQAGSVNELIESQHRAVRAVQKANPEITHQDAFNLAREKHPELFPVEA